MRGVIGSMRLVAGSTALEVAVEPLRLFDGCLAGLCIGSSVQKGINSLIH